MAHLVNEDDVAPATNDAYTGMLTISLIVLVGACLLLYLDFSQYGESQPPPLPNKLPFANWPGPVPKLQPIDPPAENAKPPGGEDPKVDPPKPPGGDGPKVDPAKPGPGGEEPKADPAKPAKAPGGE